MTNLEQLYAAERRLESELDAVREQIREAVNYLGLNKRIFRMSDVTLTFEFELGAIRQGCTALHVPSGVKRHKSWSNNSTMNRRSAISAVKHELLAMGWREE